jgi:DNA-binding MarR family transcriptional regulator
VSNRVSRSRVQSLLLSQLSRDELAAWQGLLRANAYFLRELDKDLQRSYRLNSSSYDALLQLGLTPQGRMRMTDLSDAMLYSPSGLTRLVDQLERKGLIVRERRADDARSYDAVLSPEGWELVKAATVAHIRCVRELFLDRLSEAQIMQLIDIWDTIDPRFITGRSGPDDDVRPGSGR